MVTEVIRHCADVTAFDAMRHPGAAFFRCFMQENFGARGRKRCFIIFKGYVEEIFIQEIGLIRKRHRILRVVVATKIKRHHKYMGNLG